MLHALQDKRKQAISDVGTAALAWIVSILLVVIGFPAIIAFFKEVWMLLYEILIRYNF
ncbi:hypothetical protein HGH93_19710 [Chitinophaga polysaccharea]|uniref:hypothetical protein n=1 Tax=Chitinophaga TaxID=79328 RepID=UPI00145501AF|nr:MULTISPECIES: hypothetical protein [Chitinophaga]NLR60348.1 hypothetical protein [Chitinophaga polysaccharea]NLU95989.1 hypothetical protein [Chitinophaga sp. Ak27]